MKGKYKSSPIMPERKELSNNPVKMCHEIAHLFRAKMRDISAGDEMATRHGTRSVLSFLAAGDGVTQLELVNATHLRPPTISVILKELEADGIVERRRDEADMRSIRVYLTDKGRELDSRNISKIKQLDAVALEGLDKEEQEALMRLLGKIRDNLLDEKNENIPDLEEDQNK
jgi:DNA-binding MarR family transcriptional regulator